MASSRLSKLVLILAALALSAAAQAPARVRGTVSAFDGKTLTVDGKAQVVVGDKTEIVYAQPIKLADIKPGDFLALTSSKRADGSLLAYEVRRFPKPISPGHRPFDGRDDQTMTNATVGAMVQSANGRELTMTYEGGSQKIVVPENAAVSTLVPGQRAQLVPGAPVSLTMDADRVALRIQVGPRP
jgi:hypothetical protein